MQRRGKLALLAAGALLAGGVAVGASTSPAFACTNGTGNTTQGGYQGNCPGSPSVQTGATITVATSISYRTDLEPQIQFAIGGPAPTPIGTFFFPYHVYIKSNNGAGTSMYWAGPPGGFFNTVNSGSTLQIPDTFISVGVLGGVSGTGSGTTGPCAPSTAATPLQVGGAFFNALDDQNSLSGTLACAPNTQSGEDGFSFPGFQLNPSTNNLNLPGGGYSGALTLSQFGD